MTDRELMQQALDALETNQYAVADAAPHRDVMAYNDAITALRERIKQPIIKNYLGKDNSAQPQRTHWEGCEEVHPECKKPRRELVGLTDEEVKALPQWFPSHETAAVLPLIRAIEAKLREKNT